MSNGLARPGTPLLLTFYSGVVLLALGLTPLWLDEVQQFGNTRHGTLPELLRWVQVNQGASPLPYLIQRGFVDVLGYSAFAVRLPAALCSILSGVVFVAICREMQLRHRLIAVAMFLVLPIQFRYGLEARVYSQALLLSLVSWWLFLRLSTRPSLALAALYGLAVALALYSQPLTCFPVLGQVLYAIASLHKRVNRYAVIAAVLAALSFMPWHVLQRQAQAQQARISKPIAFFSIRQITPQVLLHDLTGGGYACTLALLLLAGWALMPHQPEPPHRKLVIYILAFSLAGPILMDVIFNYFFAERQLLFAMPPLILLGAEGFERLLQQRRAAVGYVLLGAFSLSAAVKDYHQATVPKDDLARTADAAVALLHSGSCILAAPRAQVAFYVFLRPELETRICPPQPDSPEILAVIGSYATAAERTVVLDSIAPRYQSEQAVTAGRSELTIYRRR